jgi:2-succinyl-5-enolpyruvyl-6-hydroxy-3-cyclohexene-1-carboxylate synthase
MYYQPILNIAEICAQKGVEDAILSPGSRCAPLIIVFARHPEIETKSVTDERTAAFIALGIALHKQKPTVCVCTSGTAALNYGPAIAEAFYQNIPLIVLTADRPPEWLDQQDGQTIRQTNLYGSHVKASYDIPVDPSHPDAVWHVERTISEAINLAMTVPYGPVHLNVPFREPFYPEPNEQLEFDTSVKVIDQMESDCVLSESQWDELIATANKVNNIVIVGGQERKDHRLIEALKTLKQKTAITVIGDIITNLHPLEHLIRHPDLILMPTADRFKKTLQPNLLITFGQSTISKNLKLYLREYKATHHWHIQLAGPVADAYQSLRKILRVSPAYFFKEFSQRFDGHQLNLGYNESWLKLEEEVKTLFDSFWASKPNFTDLEAIKRIMDCLPDNSFLHLGNSTAVRYANFVGLNNPTIEVFSNRGTSGIDGSTSTAVGHSLSTTKLNILIVGDVAFFYDRNALWHQHLPPNLRIVVMNNHGGGIFKLIKGPSQLPEVNDFFVTKQPLSAELTAQEFKLDYLSCHSREELQQHLARFFVDDGTAKILEIFTDLDTNTKIFHQLKRHISNRYGK